MGLSKHCLLALSVVTWFGSGCEKNRKPDNTRNAPDMMLAQLNADVLSDVPSSCVHIRVKMRGVSYDVRSPQGSSTVEIALTKQSVKQRVIAPLKDGLKAQLQQTKHVCLSVEPGVPSKIAMAALISSVHAGATTHSLLFLDAQSRRRAYTIPKQGCCSPVAKDGDWALASTCEYCQWTADQRHELGPFCLAPTISLDSNGASVTARPGLIDGASEGLPTEVNISLRGQSTGNDFHLMDNVMITSGSCPSVKGTAANALTSFLQKLDQASPLCREGMLAIADDVPWSRVTQSIEAMANAGTRQITLTPGALKVSCDRQSMLNKSQ